jgi:hypothetical protein
MSRISIDVTPEQHQKVKALAALEGKSIREFVLSSILKSIDEEAAIGELEAILDERIAKAKAGELSKRTVGEIFEGVYRDHDDGPAKA